jgi:hypothetical protein
MRQRRIADHEGPHTQAMKRFMLKVTRGTYRLVPILAALLLSSACLVLSLEPSYDDDSLGWDPDLIGVWQDADDNASIKIEAAEWRLYRVHYEHPSEKGDVTGVLTIVGDEHFLDLMPARGQDRGSFLLPAHLIVRVDRAGDELVLTPLSYDWFVERLRAGRTPGAGLSAVFDQKQNALIVSATARLRAWVRAQPKDSSVWGAPATFTRQK